MNTLPKTESLKSKKLIRLLFQSGSSQFVFPFKVLYNKLSTTEKHRVMMLISVGKRNIKTAADRNHIKRLFREAYRKNKQPLIDLLERKNQYLAIGFVYVGKAEPKYMDIEEAIIKSISQLVKTLEK